MIGEYIIKQKIKTKIKLNIMNTRISREEYHDTVCHTMWELELSEKQRRMLEQLFLTTYDNISYSGVTNTCEKSIIDVTSLVNGVIDVIDLTSEQIENIKLLNANIRFNANGLIYTSSVSEIQIATYEIGFKVFLDTVVSFIVNTNTNKLSIQITE